MFSVKSATISSKLGWVAFMAFLSAALSGLFLSAVGGRLGMGLQMLPIGLLTLGLFAGTCGFVFKDTRPKDGRP